MIINLLTTEGKEPLTKLGAKIDYPIIHNACRDNPHTCMVAIALQDKYPKATYIRVDANTIRLTLDGLRYCFITPPKVKKYILDFDKLGAEAIKPFSFVTRARARVHRAGLYGTHPNWDNALRPPRKKYDPALKMRRYAKKTRVNGVCRLVPV